jgi:hypothetical protein
VCPVRFLGQVRLSVARVPGREHPRYFRGIRPIVGVCRFVSSGAESLPLQNVVGSSPIIRSPQLCRWGLVASAGGLLGARRPRRQARGKFGPIAHTDFGQRIRDVPFYRLSGEEQPLCDLGVAGARGDQ